MPFKHHPTKPVIGLIGGIGSGKSAIAREFASFGCAVIDSDAVAHQVIQSPEVKELLRNWLGTGIFHPDGSVSRRAVAERIFRNAADTQRLNDIIHPRVAEQRNIAMAGFLAEPDVVGIIWDTPLLVETGHYHQCDVLVFIDVPREIRLSRILVKRGWTPDELERREKLQIPLDKKAGIADYCIDNSGAETSSRRQVQRVLSQILASVQ